MVDEKIRDIKPKRGGKRKFGGKEGSGKIWGWETARQLRRHEYVYKVKRKLNANYSNVNAANISSSSKRSAVGGSNINEKNKSILGL